MKKAVLLCSFIITLYGYGQSKINISIHQDARLFFVGDNRNNDAFTADILAKVEVPILTNGKNYLHIYPSAEYADLTGGNYQRYAIGLGYVFNEFFKNIGAGIVFDYGNIYRQKKQFPSLSFAPEVTYKINNFLKISFLYQFTKRRDLEVMYNDKNKLILSGFFGLKFSS